MIVLAGGTVFFSCARPEIPKLQYEIVKSMADSLPALEVRLHFTPDTGKVTQVAYPNEAWGEENLFNAIRQVKLLEGNGSILLEPDSGQITINHPRDPGPMALSYKIVQDSPGPEDADDSYRPIVQPTYFHVFSHNLLAVPRHYEVGEEPSAKIFLKWTGWANDQVIHNSFGSGRREQNLGTIPLLRFHSAVFVGGDYRVHSREIEGNRIYLGIRGDWVPFTEEEVMDLLAHTVSAQREFWQDHSQEYFTVIMRPYPQENGSSFQGTGLTNSFATAISNNEFTELDQLVYLFNHELMHNWIGHTIENESEEAQYWFSEGFTDYYTSKNIAANQIDGRDWGYYIKGINETIRLLEASPVKEAPNEEITYENFWSSREFEKLPYHRGKLFAFYLDQQIIAVSDGAHSLDDVMRDLLRAAREEGQKLTHEYFLKVVNGYLAADITPFFNRHIVEGQMLPLTSLLETLGLAYHDEAMLFDLGFSFNEERTRIKDVNPLSEAFKAGVRIGDRVISHSIYFDNTEREVELVLVRDGNQIPVSYYPARMADVLQMEDNAENRDKLRK